MERKTRLRQARIVFIITDEFFYLIVDLIQEINASA
jgi:hypothetical protein